MGEKMIGTLRPFRVQVIDPEAFFGNSGSIYLRVNRAHKPERTLQLQKDSSTETLQPTSKIEINANTFSAYTAGPGTTCQTASTNAAASI